MAEDVEMSLTPADESLDNHGNDSKVSLTSQDDSLDDHGNDSKVSLTPQDDSLDDHGNVSKVSLTPQDDSLDNHNNDSKVCLTPTDDEVSNHGDDDNMGSHGNFSVTVEQMLESDDCDGDSDDDLAEVPDNILKYDIVDANKDVDGVLSSVQAKDKVKEVSYRRLVLKNGDVKDDDMKVVSVVCEKPEAKVTMGTNSQLRVTDCLNASDMTNVFKCCACNEILRTEEEIAEHSRAHINSALCSGCGRAFDSSKAVLLHKSYCSRGMEKLAKEEAGIFKCKLCDRMFNYKSTLKNHIRTFHAEKSHVCCLCDRGFPTERDLQRHSYTHTDSANKPYKCDKPGCNKAFTCKSSHNKHVRLKHEKNKVYRCSVCTRAFEMECDVKRHILTHTNIRPFKCTLCTKSYTCRSSLRQHISIIHEKKKLTCLFCNKLFHTNQDLERHITTHTGSKAWHCLACKKRYSCKSALMVHKRNVHNISFVSESEYKTEDGRSLMRKDRDDDDLNTETDEDEDEGIITDKSMLQSGDRVSDLLDSDSLSEKPRRIESDSIRVLSNNDGDLKTKEKRRKSKKPRKTKVKMVKTNYMVQQHEVDTNPD